MRTVIAKTGQPAAIWVEMGRLNAPIAAQIHDRALSVLDKMPLAFPMTEWAVEMEARLRGLVPSLAWHLFHGRELCPEYAREIEETLRRAEVVR